MHIGYNVATVYRDRLHQGASGCEGRTSPSLCRVRGRNRGVRDSRCLEPQLRVHDAIMRTPGATSEGYKYASIRSLSICSLGEPSQKTHWCLLLYPSAETVGLCPFSSPLSISSALSQHRDVLYHSLVLRSALPHEYLANLSEKRFP